MSDGPTERTPRADGFAMPAEWSPHQATLMAWPTRTRADLWGALFEEAQRDFATVANTIAGFEPVVMVVDPEQTRQARARLGANVELLPTPIDDAWVRDSGPIFVSNDRGEVALVHFGFNGWGERYRPYDRDARVPVLIAAHFGMRRYVAPMVLEGGAITVDGEGTLLTTETCLLNPNRNPSLRDDNERLLHEYWGADLVIWLPGGWTASRDTDGHIDGVAAFVAPGRVVLYAPADPSDPDHGRSSENRRTIEGAPDRELIGVSGHVLHAGGGGPHCITQQVPAGVPAS